MTIELGKASTVTKGTFPGTTRLDPISLVIPKIYLYTH
jgi:hypothetical protein